MSYISEDSKRRFTLMAGLLGAAFFVAQIALPFVLMFAVMLPLMFTQVIAFADLGEPVIWRDQLWQTQGRVRFEWRHLQEGKREVSLARLRLADLAEAGPALPVGLDEQGARSDLLAIGDRLWLIGAASAAYYDGAQVVPLSESPRPPRATRPFAFEGRPAVVSLGEAPRMAVLHLEGDSAEWRTRDLPFSLRFEGGALRSLEAVEAGGRLFFVAEVCTDEPDQCSLSYRDAAEGGWEPLVEESRGRSSWSVTAVGDRPGAVLSEFSKGGRSRLTLVVATPAGPSRREIVAPEGGFDFGVRKWRAFSRGQSLMLLGEGMPGSVKLLEVAEGRVVRSARRGGSFPFPSSMLVGMAVIQIFPLLLSLALALLLTVQMRRHRVQEYVAAGQRRRFATLWQRALAQLVDAILLGLGFVPPMVWMGRMFSDPEAMFADQGPFFPIVYFGLLAAALAWGLLVLVAFSWFEGRSGKTPGKWLLGIRVLGSDLAPCGFGRALIRNLLTFVDGFFNFLVGALLVALTENWQRLGDLAARTVVVADEKVEPSASP